MHVSGSITYFESPGEMQETGHSAEQAPQFMQLSFILYGIRKNPPYIKKCDFKFCLGSTRKSNYIMSCLNNQAIFLNLKFYLFWGLCLFHSSLSKKIRLFA